MSPGFLLTGDKKNGLGEDLVPLGVNGCYDVTFFPIILPASPFVFPRQGCSLMPFFLILCVFLTKAHLPNRKRSGPKGSIVQQEKESSVQCDAFPNVRSFT